MAVSPAANATAVGVRVAAVDVESLVVHAVRLRFAAGGHAPHGERAEACMSRQTLTALRVNGPNHYRL